MLSSPGLRTLSVSALGLTCALFPLRASAQTTPNFAEHNIRNGGDMAIVAHGDFNNDGREDLIVTDSGGGTTYYVYLYLSNGDGTYDAPIQLASAANAPYAVGDFNHDGKLDFAAGDATGKGIHVWQGHGDGTFTDAADLTSDLGVRNIVSVDVNHDSCTDLVVLAENNSVSTVQTWKSNCGTTVSFTAGQYLNSSSGLIESFSAASGDFDGDGKPDLAVVYMGTTTPSTTVQIWYGDGNGNFTNPIKATDPNGNSDGVSTVADVDDNGTSDLVMTSTRPSGTGTYTRVPYITVFKGNTNRTLTYQAINTPSGDCPASPQVADFNGDGLNDFAYQNQPCNGTDVTTNNVYVLSATGKGVFGNETSVYSSTYGTQGLLPVKSTQGSKPDIAAWQYTYANPGSYPGLTLYLLQNSTTGSFPGCGTTNQAEGINVCSPTGSTASSPVKFSLSASGPTPMRTVAVWVDGQKKSEQLADAFSNYSFLDQSLTLSAGSHNITVYGTGWDNTLQKKSFSLTVGSSGGGGSCPAPSTPSVNVCKPVNGSTVGSPVEVQATATITGTLARMEIWVDGVKKFTETTSTSFDTFLAMPNGYHKIDIYAANTAGGLWETTSYATVGSTSNGCAAPSSYSVNVCSPANASTIGSPVQVTATATIQGTLARMEVWVNGVKKYTETTSTQLSTTVSLSAGTYQFDIYAVNTAGGKYESTVHATVQ